jgi:RNA polymerase sigma-70 factor (ECF subfamily)
VENRDELRFRHLAVVHAGAVADYIRRRIYPLPKSDLDDLVEETLVVVWRRIRDVPPDQGELPWIIGVARNVLRNAHRADRRRLLHRRHLRQLGPGPSAEEEGIARLSARAAMDALAQQDREVLRLFYWDGLDLSGIGVVLGISSNAAGTRLSRATTRFQAHFQKESSVGTDDVPSDMSLQAGNNEVTEEGDSRV